MLEVLTPLLVVKIFRDTGTASDDIPWEGKPIGLIFAMGFSDRITPSEVPDKHSRLILTH